MTELELENWRKVVEQFTLNGQPIATHFEQRAISAIAWLTAELDRVTAERDAEVKERQHQWDKRKDTEAALDAALAQCAAMREALERAKANGYCLLCETNVADGLHSPHCWVEKALSNDAGKELLEWKKSAMRALGEWHEAREIIGGARIGDGPIQWAKRIRALTPEGT